jgi:hypothetical protein
VGKKSDKWDGGTAPQVHSDGEVDETNPAVSRSAPTIISSTPSNESLTGSDHKSVHSVWRRRPNLIVDVSDGGSIRKPVVTGSTDTSRDSRLGSTSSSEMCILAPTVRRESKLSRQEAACLFTEQRSRTPLKTSVSHDERHSLHNPDPEVPVRMTRRQRAPREVVCRSVGEELTDSSGVDPAGNPLFLGTIRETNLSSDGNSAGENRTVCEAFIFIYVFSAFLNLLTDFSLMFFSHVICSCYTSLYIVTVFLSSIKSSPFYVTVLSTL